MGSPPRLARWAAPARPRRLLAGVSSPYVTPGRTAAPLACRLSGVFFLFRRRFRPETSQSFPKPSNNGEFFCQWPCRLWGRRCCRVLAGDAAMWLGRAWQWEMSTAVGDIHSSGRCPKRPVTFPGGVTCAVPAKGSPRPAPSQIWGGEGLAMAPLALGDPLTL